MRTYNNTTSNSNWNSGYSDNYTYNYNNTYSSNRRNERMRECRSQLLCWGTCLAIAGGIATSIGVPVRRMRLRKAEEARVQTMAEATGQKLSAIDEALWDLDCDDAMSRYQLLFRKENNEDACENGFEDFTNWLNSTEGEQACANEAEQTQSPTGNQTVSEANSNSTQAPTPEPKTNTQKISDLVDNAATFIKGTPPRSKNNETYLDIACQERGKVNAITEEVREALCLQEGFELEGSINDFLSSLDSDECFGLSQTMNNFITMADGSCAEPQTTVGLLEQCNATPEQLKETVKEFTRPDRADNCYKELCDLKKFIADIVNVSTDNGRYYRGFGMYYPLFYRSGPSYLGGRGYGDKSVSVSRKNGSTSKVTGRTNFGGGRGGASGVRGGSGTVAGRPGG